MSKVFFGTTSIGEEIHKYSIGNKKGMKAEILNYGACIYSLYVPDKEGNLRDVVLGYKDGPSYETENAFFGAVVGPNANRIADATCIIEGVEYYLGANNNENNLHSGSKTLAKKVWNLKEHTENKLVLSYENPHLEQGFPGNMEIEVTYEINEENQLSIVYHGVSDRTTVFNMTNHSYFNLNGWESGSILGHELMMKASCYTPVKSHKAIPTGEIASVEGTPFDFRIAKTIGRDIEKDDTQLIYGHGYDHNFAFDKEEDGVEKLAECYAPESGIVMEVFTDCVGVQLYTGNLMEGQIGKNGRIHHKWEGFCMETQFYPNAVNEPNFKSPVIPAGEHYQSKTIYGFGVK